MFFSELCIFFYDFLENGMGWKTGNGFVGDLVYCVFGIGVIEETVKIIPFLIMFKFTREINESVDYVIYAAVSALGFAFMENLIYFQDSGLDSITGRALICAVGHMSYSCIAVYGLFYCVYRKNGRHKLLYFAASFAAAVLFHGFYDLILMTKQVEFTFRMPFFFATVIGEVFIFSRIIDAASYFELKCVTHLHSRSPRSSSELGFAGSPSFSAK
jgi:RsiW-degrading membrane proteinase PrsW (M82 family)